VAALVRTIRLDVAYDGTEFHGWQTQPGLRTVQGVLEEALAEALGEEEVTIAGAGRTDAGTHARGQVATFTTEAGLPTEAFVPVLRRLLPEDVLVTGARECAEGFHARHSAVARRYAYRLLDRPDPILRRIAWHPKREVDADALEAAVRPLAGVHDCASFRASGCASRRSECVVHHLGWRRWEAGLVFDVVADHFLYHMVRNVVGTALELSEEEDPEGAMARVLSARDRRLAGPTVPPEGLCLEQVLYPEDRAA
jgi:tRNA pseudouridine38-40 synthase